MLDVHCHLLPAVDDGAPDLAAALEMARVLRGAGFTSVAPSPHYGEGPGGDVTREVATRVREDLSDRLSAEHIDLELLPNAEHHITPLLFERIGAANVTPVGGHGRWLLVELPWRAIPGPEDILFRLQTKGFRLLLAHPERYNYLEVPAIERLVFRGVMMQVELGSFVDVYGERAEKRARTLVERGCVHVAASDLHRPEDGHRWLDKALREFERSFGKAALKTALDDNPRALVADASHLLPCVQP